MIGRLLFSKSKSHNDIETFMVRTAGIKRKRILQADNLYAAIRKKNPTKEQAVSMGLSCRVLSSVF